MRWVAGLGLPATLENELPLAFILRTRTPAGMRDVTPNCYQLGSLSTICELSDYPGSRPDYYQYTQGPSTFCSPFIQSITYLYDLSSIWITSLSKYPKVPKQQPNLQVLLNQVC